MANVDPNNEATYRVVVVPNNLTDAKKPEAMILKDVVACGFDEDSTFAIKLALEEAMTNAVRHGNAGDAGKTVTVRYAVSPEKVVICVRDEGPGFQPDCIPDPTHPDRLSLPCGRGIMLMKAYMNEVEYRCDGCEVRMMKLNPAIANDESESESETSP